MQKATDPEVFARVAQEDRIIIRILAPYSLCAMKKRRPVILLRHGSKRAAVQVRLLLGAMPVIEGPLDEGIIVIEEKRIRVRRLPIGGSE